jgi:uncharacterized protein (TIGR02246 family)
MLQVYKEGMWNRTAATLGVIVIALLVLDAGGQALAGNEGARAESDGTVLIAKILAAWSHADARGIAALYELNGDFVSPDGTHAIGQRAIEAFYRAAFDNGYAGSSASTTDIHLRKVSATIVVIDGSWTINPTNRSKITVPEAGLFFAVLRKRVGHWRIVALREQTSTRTLHENN